MLFLPKIRRPSIDLPPFFPPTFPPIFHRLSIVLFPNFLRPSIDFIPFFHRLFSFLGLASDGYRYRHNTRKEKEAVKALELWKAEEPSAVGGVALASDTDGDFMWKPLGRWKAASPHSG